MDALPLRQWEGARAEELARAWGVPELHLYAEVGSTNDAARALAQAGAPAGTLVLAEAQTAGRGRSGRSWVSPPGLGLWFSLVLRPTASTPPALLPLLVGLAAARALDEFARPHSLQLKWPNDLLLQGRKIAGILCEGVWEANGPAFIVAGMGLNVLHREEDFPPGLRASATSLCLAAGMAPSRREVAGALVRELMQVLADPPAALEGSWASEMSARDVLAGHELFLSDVADLDAKHPATALGVAPDGALLVRTPQGALRRVYSGTVRLADAAVAAALPGAAPAPLPTPGA